MPLYEYLCAACGHRFERIQKFSDPPIAICPQCGGPVEKQISSPAIQFKGSGWYVNDYAKSGKPESTAKSNQTDKPDKSDKSEKSDAGSKAGDSATSEKSEKSETSAPVKTDAPAAKPSSADGK